MHCILWRVCLQSSSDIQHSLTSHPESHQHTELCSPLVWVNFDLCLIPVLCWRQPLQKGLSICLLKACLPDLWSMPGHLLDGLGLCSSISSCPHMPTHLVFCLARVHCTWHATSGWLHFWWWIMHTPTRNARAYPCIWPACAHSMHLASRPPFSR